MPDSIEDRVIRWLRENPKVKVVEIKQSTACNSGERRKRCPRFGGVFALDAAAGGLQLQEMARTGHSQCLKKTLL